jgi:hypothetical protein
MEDIIQQIENVFAKHKLIGNKDFSEDEYALMVDYVSTLSDNFDKDSYKLIFVTLVLIAKRWRQSDATGKNKEDSGYWEYVFKILFGSDIDQQLCQKYRSVISWLGENSKIPIVTSGQNYYATIMMHSYAPKNSIFSFFDLCYIGFKKDLDFGFTTEDEWYCERVVSKMRAVLGGGYSEDKKVSIGSSAYSIKIGLRSFALNENLSDDFIEFIKDTFYQINKLFNREKIDENTRLKRYIVKWWKNKAESEKVSDDTTRKKRIATVSKQNIVAKYIREDRDVLLCIPSIRLEDENSKLILTIYVSGDTVLSEEIRTERGELVVTTKQVEKNLNNLLRGYESINIQVKITENEAILYDSEETLNREFILFDGEKEIFSQINKPTNYFVYSKEIDALKSVPDELTTFGTNFYNIYPNAGESLIGKIKQVFFVDKTKTSSLGKNACLIGSVADVEWILDDISCIVYKNAVKLMIPENYNLKALELKIDNKRYKLQELNYERIELNCYQFGLKVLGLISEYYPTEISLYSYEKEKELLIETIIVLPELDLKFNNPFYYGNIERKITINSNNEIMELSWNKQDDEIICPINDGILVVKVPCLKWRINNDEWRNEPINKKVWYKNLLNNGDLLEIDNPKGNETVSIFGKADGKSFEIAKNQNGKFEIGRAIYANEKYTNISVRFSDTKKQFDLFNIATKEHFADNPLIHNNGKVYWDVENTFVGSSDNDFLLDVGGKNVFRNRIDGKNKEILNNIKEDIYKIIVKIKDKNIFLKDEKWDTVFEGNLIIGKPEKFRFKKKYICIESINTAFSADIDNNWITPRKNYIIRDLEYLEIQDGEQIIEYYVGRLKIARQDNSFIDYLENEKGEKDQINPVRIELRSNNSFWLVAGYDKDNDDFLGELIFDNARRELCNINSSDRTRYKVANIYKFKEEEYV